MTGVMPGTERWDELKRGIVSNDDRNWRLGDAALEIAPMGEDGAHNGAFARLQRWLDEVAAERGVIVAFKTLLACRLTAAAWAPTTRVVGASWKAHQILMAPDRHHLLRPGMTTTQASEAAGHVNRARRPVGRRRAGHRTPEALAQEAERVVEAVGDPEVRAEVTRQLAEVRGTREADRTLRAAVRELEAAQLDADRRAAEDERERLRLIEVARGQADQTIKTWDKLIAEVRAAWTVIAAYSADLGDLPALHPAYERMLFREIDELNRQVHWIERRLRPDGPLEPLRQGTVIDVDGQPG